MNEETIINSELAENAALEENITIESPEAEENITAELEAEESFDSTPAEDEGIEALKEEIRSLKEQISTLEAERETHSRMLQEVSDFSLLFPDVELNDVPECVWESVKKGTALSASYALYEKRLEAERARIAKINASNAMRSAGIAGKDNANEYFTPEDVRKMSPSEVHANYSKIKRSMSKWM